MGSGPSRGAAGRGCPGLGPVPHTLPRKETWEPPWDAGPLPGSEAEPWAQPPRADPHVTSLLSLSHVMAPQTHGSRLRLHLVSPADSGEYVCRVALGSGPLEASVLVTIEASGSGTVVVPGEILRWGWEAGGGGGPGQEASERVLSPGG